MDSIYETFKRIKKRKTPVKVEVNGTLVSDNKASSEIASFFADPTKTKKIRNILLNDILLRHYLTNN